jgi:hypothetical protein
VDAKVKSSRSKWKNTLHVLKMHSFDGCKITLNSLLKNPVTTFAVTGLNQIASVTGVLEAAANGIAPDQCFSQGDQPASKGKKS